MRFKTDSYRPGPVMKQTDMSPFQGAAVANEIGPSDVLSDLERSTDPDLFRAYRIATPWAAVAVDIRRDQITSAEWDIMRIDPTLGTDDEDVRLRLIDLFQSPDRTGALTNHASMMGPFNEDFLVVGIGALHLIYNELDEITGLRNRDGSKVSRNPAWTAKAEEDNPLRRSERDPAEYTGVPRYFYKEGRKSIPLASRELLVMESNPVTYSDKGLAPMQSLHRFLLGEKDLFRALHATGRNLQPSGIIKVPDPNPDTVEDIEKVWRSKLQGKGGIAVLGVPADTDFIQVGADDIHKLGVLDVYDIVVRGILACFRMPTTVANWTRTTLERTADEQGELMDTGILNLMRVNQLTINTSIVAIYPGAENLEFRYLQLPQAEEADSVDTLKKKAGELQLWTGNEARDAAGLDRIEYPKELAPYYEEMPWSVPGSRGTYLPVSLIHELFVKPILEGKATLAASIPKLPIPIGQAPPVADPGATPPGDPNANPAGPGATNQPGTVPDATDQVPSRAASRKGLIGSRMPSHAIQIKIRELEQRRQALGQHRKDQALPAPIGDDVVQALAAEYGSFFEQLVLAGDETLDGTANGSGPTQ